MQGSQETAGKVWLVGAGPSDAGLLTIRARDVIRQAQTVVYDRLVGPDILMMVPEDAERIDVGKRAGYHRVPQEEINRILLRKALEGKRVVRLKGGDPFLFGRGGEELELLRAHGIPFEVVPGVTSAIAVPAYNGIPVTHRDCASSLHILTGHRKKGERLNLDFEALVRVGGTLVFLMGASSLPEICAGLLRAGMDADMPAAVLQKGMSAEQKKITATVATLEDKVREQGIEPPAVIVVGRVCSESMEFAWYEKKPLFGRRIIVTRPRERSPQISAKLRELGAEVWEIPSIRTVPIRPNPALDEAITHLSDYDYLVFTSPAGVDYFMEAMADRKTDIRRFADGKIAAIGSGTVGALKKYGLFADLVPQVYDTAHLGALIGEDCRKNREKSRDPHSICGHWQREGDRRLEVMEPKILIPRARSGSAELVEEIRRRTEARITDLPVYDTVCAEPEFIDEKAALAQGQVSMVIFTSASTVRGFAQATAGLDYTKVTAACIGRQTGAEAEKLGMRVYTAREATVDALADLAVEIVSGTSEVKQD